MNSKAILIVSGEPNSIFLDIYFKILTTKKIASPLILITSEKLLKPGSSNIFSTVPLFTIAAYLQDLMPKPCAGLATSIPMLLVNVPQPSGIILTCLIPKSLAQAFITKPSFTDTTYTPSMPFFKNFITH